ncbi:NAD(P)H-hydrate dehydratase [Scytonema sp. UIC 10036]|uniref:NAD(P)H-hydrate dehydratase n=1 Tax=Scytonema sp. UIC 10036 TaxID=2304196 RepID=UPI00140FD66E|nr:NAD(P)H-hydrate dehydratase [Scytonema sp. UIC 10036]
MLLLFGSVPDPSLPLTMGAVQRDEDVLMAEGRRFSRTQGTGAMIGAALAVTTSLGLDPPYALVAGDIGDGKGTKALFQYLTQNIVALSPQVLTLHYCLPIMGLLKKLCQAIPGCPQRPILIADAGGMYAAKGAGLAQEFDIFTPDTSEIAFLADPQATHPAYISHHLFASDASAVPEQIKTAFQLNSAAKLLLVKGKTDYVAIAGQIVATIDQPNVPTLEPIGGTGDTITGLVSALVYAGLSHKEAAVMACRINRIAGQMAQPTPATKVRQVVDQFPMVLAQYYSQWTQPLAVQHI